nr:MAG TPA: hypothetical protein [Caudoviricetes sp.]
MFFKIFIGGSIPPVRLDKVLPSFHLVKPFHSSKATPPYSGVVFVFPKITDERGCVVMG